MYSKRELDVCCPRRAKLMNMFDKCHIAPSYRWRAHQSWATSMTLLVDLLRGNGKHRYLRTIALPRLSGCLYLWFFSGSTAVSVCATYFGGCHTCQSEAHCKVLPFLQYCYLGYLFLKESVCCSTTTPVKLYVNGDLDLPP